MQIRKMTGDDAGAVAKLCAQLGYPSSAEEVARRLALLAEGRDHALFVAEASAQVVGWVHVNALRRLEAGPLAEVWGLVVDESRRGQGIGNRLLLKAEEWALERGLYLIRLRSNIIRSGAHAFYRRLGYDLVKTQYTFQKTLPGGSR